MVGHPRVNSRARLNIYIWLLVLVTAGLTVLFAWLVTTPMRYNYFLAPLLISSAVALGLAVSRPLWLFPLIGATSIVIIALPLGRANIIPADIFVLCVLLAWFGSRDRQHWPVEGKRLLLPFVLLIGISLVTLTYSQDQAFGTVKLIQLSEYFLVFLLTTSMLREPRWIGYTFLAYVCSCLVFAVAAIIDVIVNGIHSNGVYLLFLHKNGLGLFLLMALAIVTAMLLYRQDLSPRQRTYWIATWAVILVATILSGSRGAWLGYIVAVILLVLPKGAAYVMRVAAVMLLALIVANVALPQELLRTNEIAPALQQDSSYVKGGSIFVRVVIWRDALGIIAAHPLTGLGVGGYVSYDTYQGNALDFNSGDPHNMILYEWAELGTIGLVIFLWFIGAILRVSWQAFTRAGDGETRWLGGAILATLAGYLTMSLTEPFWTRGNGLFFFLLIGVAVNLISLQPRPSAALGVSAAGRRPLLAAHTDTNTVAPHL